MADDPRTAATERNMLPAVGPKFLRGPDGEVLFQYVIDASNIIGPRPASEADKRTHVEAWERFQREQAKAALATARDPAPSRRRRAQTDAEA